MPSMKFAFLAVIVFAAPIAATVGYYLNSQPAAANSSDRQLIGNILFFSSPS